MTRAMPWANSFQPLGLVRGLSKKYKLHCIKICIHISKTPLQFEQLVTSQKVMAANIR